MHRERIRKIQAFIEAGASVDVAPSWPREHIAIEVSVSVHTLDRRSVRTRSNWPCFVVIEMSRISKVINDVLNDESALL